MAKMNLEVKISKKWWVIPVVKMYAFSLAVFRMEPSEKVCDVIIGHGLTLEIVKND